MLRCREKRDSAQPRKAILAAVNTNCRRHCAPVLREAQWPPTASRPNLGSAHYLRSPNLPRSTAKTPKSIRPPAILEVEGREGIDVHRSLFRFAGLFVRKFPGSGRGNKLFGIGWRAVTAFPSWRCAAPAARSRAPLAESATYQMLTTKVQGDIEFDIKIGC